MTALTTQCCGRDAEKYSRYCVLTLFVAALVVVLATFSACQPLSTRRTPSSSPNSSTSANKSTDKQNQTPAIEDLAAPAAQADSSQTPARKKIPTLREQMERLQTQQEQMNARLDTVQSELRTIRQRVEESPRSSEKSSEAKQPSFIRGDAPPSSATKAKTPTSESKSPSTAKSVTGQQTKSKDSGLILPDGDEEAPANQPRKTAEKKNTEAKTPKLAKNQDASAEDEEARSLGDIISADNESGTKTPIKPRKRISRPPTSPTKDVQTAPSKTPESALKKTPIPASKEASTASLPPKAGAKEPKSQLDAAMNEAPAAAKGEGANPLFGTATSLFNKRQYQEAIDLFNQVSSQEKSPEVQSRAQYWIGESYYGLGKYDDAIRTFNKVLSAKSTEKSSKAMSMIAESMIRLGQSAEAKKTYQRLLKQYPQSEEAVRAAKRLQQL